LISNVKITLIGDFISGEIVHKYDNILEPISIATIIIQDNDKRINSSEVLKIGDIISIRVITSQYPPMKNKITIIGEVLLCEEHELTFNVQNNITEEHSLEINDIKIKIDKELLHRKTIKKEALDKILTFDRLLHSYSSKPSDPRTEISEWVGYEVEMDKNIIDILSIDENKYDFTGIWTKSNDLYLSSPLIKKCETDIDEHTITIASGIFIVMVLETMLSYLIITREMSIIYDDKLFEKHKLIWRMMENLQIKK
jgi:hypothetical protein